jgi:hypothetical protein
VKNNYFIEDGTLEQDQILCDKLNRSIKVFLSRIENDLEVDLTIG